MSGSGAVVMVHLFGSDWARPTIGALVALGCAIGVRAPVGAQVLSERPNHGLVEVITGGVEGTSVRMVQDLATIIDDGATRRVVPVVGKGSLQNLLDLKALRGVDLAIVPTDVLDYARAHRLYPGVDSSVTYIAKLYNEEFHLLARADIKSVAELAGKKVNVGIQTDGTSVTGPRIFELLRIKVEVTSYDPGLALGKLKLGEIAALAYVAGKPAPLFTSIRPQDGLHFLAVPLKPEIVSAYIPTRFTADDYPDLLRGQEPVDTVAVGAVMLVANLVPASERYRNVVNFVDAFFTQFPKLLEAPHHAKWSEVNLAAELPGWRRFPPADAWLKRNGSAPVALNEQQLRDIFSKFLDERGRASGRPLTAQEKGELFDQFRRWLSGEANKSQSSR